MYECVECRITTWHERIGSVMSLYVITMNDLMRIFVRAL